MKRFFNFFIIFILSVVLIGSLTACGAKTTAYSGDKWLRLDYGAEMEARDDAELNREHIEIPDGVDTIEIDGVEYNVIRRDMNDFKRNCNNILANDIDYFKGGYETYKGIFNGNNYKIKGRSGGEGLFERIEDAVVENVIFSSDITVGNYNSFGYLFIGSAKNSVIKNCVNYFPTGMIECDCCSFIGLVENCEIINCVNYGDARSPGGICYSAKNGTRITDCINYGNVNCLRSIGDWDFGDDYFSAGGIVGRIVGDVHISGCKNYGDIIAKDRMGGIVGGVYLSDLYSQIEDESIINAKWYTENQVVEDCINYGNLYLRLDHAGDKSVTKPYNYHQTNGENIYGIGGIAGCIAIVKNCKNEGKFYGFENLESGLKVDYSGGIAGVAREVPDCETKYTISVQKGRALHVGKLVGYTIK